MEEHIAKKQNQRYTRDIYIESGRNLAQKVQDFHTHGPVFIPYKVQSKDCNLLTVILALDSKLSRSHILRQFLI